MRSFTVTANIKSSDNIALVRPEGFEPPTFWFVAKHSIQLSYERIFLTNNKYNTKKYALCQEFL